MLCLEAWHKLESERLPGPVCWGPIPRLAIKQWAEWEGIDREIAIVIADVLQAQDVKRATRISSELQLKKGSKQ